MCQHCNIVVYIGIPSFTITKLTKSEWCTNWDQEVNRKYATNSDIVIHMCRTLTFSCKLIKVNLAKLKHHRVISRGAWNDSDASCHDKIMAFIMIYVQTAIKRHVGTNVHTN